jgi:hypothetical protein
VCAIALVHEHLFIDETALFTGEEPLSLELAQLAHVLQEPRRCGHMRMYACACIACVYVCSYVFSHISQMPCKSPNAGPGMSPHAT